MTEPGVKKGKNREKYVDLVFEGGGVKGLLKINFLV